ncbi:MAG: hypothetical protein J1E00_07905 [Oscillospiraceae bacterium]|nr:hypothetical protein [Oscillospiraceae bacterium]
MKLTRIFSLLLALIMALCVLAACGTGEPDLSGPGNKEGTFSIPTEYSYSMERDGATMSVKIHVEFQENQLTLTSQYEESNGEFSRSETEKSIYLLDEYGNVVREMREGIYTGGNSVYDYVYTDGGRRLRAVSSRSGGYSSDRFYVTAYAHNGDIVTSEEFYDQGSRGKEEKTYVYDKNGRLVKEASDRYGWTETYEYDEHGTVTKNLTTREDGDDTLREFKNEYSDGKLKRITGSSEADGEKQEVTLSVGKYESFKMTKGQYLCALLLSLYQDAEMFRGEGTGSGEIRYADGTVLVKAEQDGDGKVTRETYYLPEGKVDYVCEYTYHEGRLRTYTYRNAEGETLLTLNTDAAGSLLNAGENVEYEYDEQGNVVKMTVLHYDGSIDYIEEYDENGNLAKTHFYQDGAYGSTTEYDRENNTYTRMRLREDGSFEWCTVYDSATDFRLRDINYFDDGAYVIEEFDRATGHQISCVCYYAGGALYYEQEFDAFGRLTKETDYYESGALSSVQLFDENENCTELTGYDEDGSFLFHMTYEYDADDFYIKSVGYDEDGNLLWYSIPAYDEAGNIISESDYRPDGSLESRSERTYDEDGNLLTNVTYFYDEEGNLTGESHWDP